jgi:PAS domain S-box-containing protein
MTGEFPLDVEALRKVLNYLNIGVYITDPERRILLWNRKAEQITGYLESEVEGKSCHDDVLNHINKDGDLLCPSERCPLHRSMLLGKAGGEPLLVFAKRADGERIAVSVDVAPLLGEGGEVIGGIEVFRDETDSVRDLEMAKEVQRYILPKTMPVSDAVQMDVCYYPHDLIGGDFYDIYSIGENRYGVLVADVRGHGVSASLCTMLLKSLGDSLSAEAADPAGFVTALNSAVTRFLQDENFATALYAVVDMETAQVSYTNAGHCSPLHFRAADGMVNPLKSHGLPLGIIAGMDYESDTVDLAPGDLLLAYTDGVTESECRDGDMLAEAGLAEALKKAMDRGVSGLLERLYAKVLGACGMVGMEDDVLMLSVFRRP